MIPTICAFRSKPITASGQSKVADTRKSINTHKLGGPRTNESHCNVFSASEPPTVRSLRNYKYATTQAHNHTLISSALAHVNAKTCTHRHRICVGCVCVCVCCAESATSYILCLYSVTNKYRIKVSSSTVYLCKVKYPRFNFSSRKSDRAQ